MAAAEHDDKVISEIYRNVILVDYFIDGVHSQDRQLCTGVMFSLQIKANDDQFS